MTQPLREGLYESVVSNGLDKKLQSHLGEYNIGIENIDPAERPKIFSKYLSEAIERTLTHLLKKEDTLKAIQFCQDIIQLSAKHKGSIVPDDYPTDNQLLSFIKKNVNPLIAELQFERPGIPLSQSALLVNARGEFKIGNEIIKEIQSSNRIDLLCSFIKWSGFVRLKDYLRKFSEKGGKIRVLTTAYMGATDQKVLDELEKMGAEIKVSLDVRRTRLHAKAWLFHRDTGYSTAYIGSSNMSAAALTDGLEWNVRVSNIDSPIIIEKFSATFDNYWNDVEFEAYKDDKVKVRFDDIIKEQRGEAVPEFTLFDISPFPYQKEILERLEVERLVHNRYNNLVVSATGTGKTIIAAFDFRREFEKDNSINLLFVAHRDEILKQSLNKFRQVLRDSSFGELFVGGIKPTEGKNLFASIQSLSNLNLLDLQPKQFKYVVIDEFHHAEAPTYVKLLDHLKPNILLGLTATPERMDNKDIRRWFDGYTAVELRIWDAIERGNLAPFQYFGIYDNTDLSSITWKRGEYDEKEIENLFTATDIRVNVILKAIGERILSAKKMKALGFCVGVNHANYMALRFNEAGIAAESLTSESSKEVRANVIGRLQRGDLNVIFTVDLFNEGVDIPDIDTVLLLRPTQSATIFLQQIGRGLRLSTNKSHLTILDFIGQCSVKYRFDVRYRAFNNFTRKELSEQIENNFPLLPSGCSIQLDRISRDIVLRNVRQSLTLSTQGLVREIMNFGRDITLIEFIRDSRISLNEIYRNKRYWMQLKHSAGLITDSTKNLGDDVAQTFSRLINIDDGNRIKQYRKLLQEEALNVTHEKEKRMLLMLVTNLFGETAASNPVKYLNILRKNNFLKNELLELFEVLSESINHKSFDFLVDKNVALKIHCRYSLTEIFAAFGDVRNGKLFRAREGEHFDKKTKCNLIFITLQKAEKDYSPSTMYRDYALSDRKFHWQSQSTTKRDSVKGQRLIDHKALGIHHLLFVRTKKQDERKETNPYIFLGEANCISDSGERPINIEWELEAPMPTEFYRQCSVVAS